MRLLLLLLLAAAAHAQPAISFLADPAPGTVNLSLAGGAAATGLQLSFAVPPGTVISPGPALGTKTLNSNIKAGAATVLIVGTADKAPLTDGILAKVTFPAIAWPFSAVNPTAVDAAGQLVPGVTVAGLAFTLPQPVFQRDSWKFAAPGYRLSYPVYGGEKNALVYLNGLLQLQGADYQLVGTLLQFNQDLYQFASVTIQVIYWH